MHLQINNLVVVWTWSDNGKLISGSALDKVDEKAASNSTKRPRSWRRWEKFG